MIKKFEELLNEQNKFETDTLTIDDETIKDYLGNDKVIIVSDADRDLKSAFKPSDKISKDKILGTMNKVKTVFMNLKIVGDHHFYYFNFKDKSKVQKIIK